MHDWSWFVEGFCTGVALMAVFAIFLAHLAQRGRE